MEHDLNDAIYNTLTKDNTKLRNWIHSQKDERLKTWNGEIPYVSIVITKPFYFPKKNQTIVTRAVGVRGPRKWSKLLREVISTIDVEKNAASVSFVSYDLLSAGRAMLSQYEKIIYMQQKVLRNHSFQTLCGITLDIFPKVYDKILKVPGVLAMNKTKQHLSMGKYRLLTQANMPYSRLQLIDDILSKVHFSPDTISPGGDPRRLVKMDEKINPDLKMA